MNLYEELTSLSKSVAKVAPVAVARSGGKNSPANDRVEKAPLAAIVEATDDINPSDAQSRALEAVSDQEISKTIIEACRVEYEYRRAGRIVEADKINGLLDSIDSPELKTSDPAFIRSYLDLVRALKQ
jgi:predicted PP-loop superfamily ATPase